MFVNNQDFQTLINLKVSIFVTKFVGIAITGCKSMGMKFKIELKFIKILFPDRGFSFRIELFQDLSVPAQNSVDLDNLFFIFALYLVIKAVSALCIAKLLINSSNNFFAALQA